MILAAAGVQTRLVDEGLRSFVSIIVRSAECVDPHAFAVLIGVGATAVNAYLAQESVPGPPSSAGPLGPLALRDALSELQEGAIEAGLLKVLAKKGISVVSSYRGGRSSRRSGLSRALVAEFFPGMPSRVSGIGLAGIARRVLDAAPRGLGRATRGPAGRRPVQAAPAAARPTPSTAS